jgi:hypothetical protein
MKDVRRRAPASKACILAKLDKYGPCTCTELAKKFPDLHISQIRTAIQNLKRERKVSVFCRTDNRSRTPGRSENAYVVNKSCLSLPRRRRKDKPLSVEEAENLLSDGLKIEGQVTLLDKKTALLRKLIAKAGGPDRDLLINILHDYGEKHVR